jgi:hypothetical protein
MDKFGNASATFAHRAESVGRVGLLQTGTCNLAPPKATPEEARESGNKG